MDLPDDELRRLLEARDGPFAQRYGSHAAGGGCPYADLYQKVPCPWCAAKDRRLARESGSASASTQG